LTAMEVAINNVLDGTLSFQWWSKTGMSNICWGGVFHANDDEACEVVVKQTLRCLWKRSNMTACSSCIVFKEPKYLLRTIQWDKIPTFSMCYTNK
jgi:hypothetical protein